MVIVLFFNQKGVYERFLIDKVTQYELEKDLKLFV